MTRLSIESPKLMLKGLPLLQQIKFRIVNTLEGEKPELIVAALRASVEKNQPEFALEKEIEQLTAGFLGKALKAQRFNASEGKTALVRYASGSMVSEAAALGLGGFSSHPLTLLSNFQNMKNSSTVTMETAQLAGKSLANLLSVTNSNSLCLHIKEEDLCPKGLQALLEGFLLEATSDDRYKSEKNNKNLKLNEMCIYISLKNKTIKDYEKVFENSANTAKGVQITRELVSSPPNFCNTESLAKIATRIAIDNGLEYDILDEKACRSHNMGAYLAVHQGSMYEPQFIHLKYVPKHGNAKVRVALIGKGLCMDTGGYNLKVGCGIETMKLDMGGAAAVLGTAATIGQLKPESVEVHFIVAAAENMISSRAYRPGDILKASNGKTIEVGNTDAEGRLTLADALVYTEKIVKPDYILDCATLTGAITVGLGNDIAGVYGTNSEFLQRVLQSSINTGTLLWPMPNHEPYRKLNDSKLADICNTSNTRCGGSITAFLFLKEFVEKTPFCHIDLAGPAYDSTTKEGTGFGTKLLIDLISSFSEAA